MNESMCVCVCVCVCGVLAYELELEPRPRPERSRTGAIPPAGAGYAAGLRESMGTAADART